MYTNEILNILIYLYIYIDIFIYIYIYSYVNEAIISWYLT